MSLPALIIGFGGHARVLIDTLLKQNAPILGAVELEATKIGTTYRSVAVIGDDEFAKEQGSGSVLLINGIGSVSVATRRRTVFDHYKKLGFQFRTVIHPSAVISDDVNIGEGAQIMAGVIVQPGVEIGGNTIINTRASIDHDCRIGDHAHIAPGVTLSGHVSIGECSMVGAGATIIQNIEVGPECMIGAGATLVRSVTRGQSLAGVPAR